MAEIEKTGKLHREALSSEQYFKALLEQGYQAQLLCEAELEQIQFACLALLAKKTERFNGGDSSSVRTEQAQEILASLLFTLGVQLKAYPCPDDALVALQRDGIEHTCNEGRRRIERLLKQAKMRHFALSSHLLHTNNMFYAATIVDGIRGFFKLYNPDFAAQEIHITADYPVYNKARRLLGIEFIWQYLEQLYLENMFLAHFDANIVHHLLCGYDVQYESLLFNLYEPVLAAALGCVMAGTEAGKLEITPEMQAVLYACFTQKAGGEVLEALAAALAQLSRHFSFPERLQAYAQESLPLLAAAIEAAVKEGSLDRIFLAPKYPENAPKLIVAYGEKMDDEHYRRVLEEFTHSRTMVDKIDIMKQHIHFLNDLNDLLLDADLTAQEIATLLKERTPAEIAALMKKYTAHDAMSFPELRDNETTLCEGLHLFVSRLPAQQQTMLKRAVEILEVDHEAL